MVSIDYPKLVKELRRQQQMTQEALAREIGVAFSTLNKWENGHRQPQPFLAKEVTEMAAAAGLNLQDYDSAADRT